MSQSDPGARWVAPVRRRSGGRGDTTMKRLAFATAAAVMMCSCIGTGTGAAATCDWCTAPIVGLAVLAVALVVMLAGDDAVRRKATKADPDLPMPQRDRALASRRSPASATGPTWRA